MTDLLPWLVQCEIMPLKTVLLEKLIIMHNASCMVEVCYVGTGFMNLVALINTIVILSCINCLLQPTGSPHPLNEHSNMCAS